jgi:hypothetical protein
MALGFEATSDKTNLEESQKQRKELFLEARESCHGVMSYVSEQAVLREFEIQREIMSIQDNMQKYIRYLELSSRKRSADIVFTIPRRRW